MIKAIAVSFLAVTGISAALAQPALPSLFVSTITLPPVGLGATETFEVNVVNLASNSNNGTPASCTGTVTFLNASGTAIGSAQTFTVTAGQTSSIRLSFANAGGTGTRTTVRANVAVTPATTTPRPPCSLEVSAATFDTSSGATHAVISPVNQPSGLLTPVRFPIAP
jgi:hypothetical protein